MRNSSSTFTQAVVSLPAGQSTKVADAKWGRHYLGIQNVGTGRLSLGFGATAVADSGWALGAALSSGDGGGVMTFTNSEGVPQNAIYAISAAGTTVVVLEG